MRESRVRRRRSPIPDIEVGRRCDAVDETAVITKMLFGEKVEALGGKNRESNEHGERKVANWAVWSE